MERIKCRECGKIIVDHIYDLFEGYCSECNKIRSQGGKLVDHGVYRE